VSAVKFLFQKVRNFVYWLWKKKMVSVSVRGGVMDDWYIHILFQVSVEI
jgi:hypothetical protein